MAKNKSKKKDKEKPELNQDQEKLSTKPIEKKTESQETKPAFKELLSKGEKSASSTDSFLPGSEDEILEPDENIIEVCADIIAIPFAIWHEINPDVPPLTEKEKKNISLPLAKVATKYDLGRYLKEEFVLVFYLGSAIYGRTKIKKVKEDDKDDHRQKRPGENEPNAGINPR